jgi:DNA-binding transcriptional LysR family regulator
MDLLRNIGLLRHFMAVAKEGNVTAAAERLGISQPALTKSIRRLEEECGAPLFDRHTRGVSLTLYGKALLRHARLIDAECRFATSEIEALRHGHRGQLRIGGGPFWGATLLPQAVGQLHHRFPDLRVQLQIGVNAVVHPLLFEGELDLVVSAAPDLAQLPSHTAFRPINTIHMRIFAREGHPLFGNTAVHVDRLSHYQWVVYQHDPEVIGRLTAALSSRGGGTPPRIAVEASSLLATLELVRSSDFLACLAAPLVGILHDFGIRAVPIDVEIWSFPSGVLYHRALETSAPFTFLTDHLIALASRLDAAEAPDGSAARTRGRRNVDRSPAVRRGRGVRRNP